MGVRVWAIKAEGVRAGEGRGGVKVPCATSAPQTQCMECTLRLSIDSLSWRRPLSLRLGAGQPISCIFGLLCVAAGAGHRAVRPPPPPQKTFTPGPPWQPHPPTPSLGRWAAHHNNPTADAREMHRTPVLTLQQFSRQQLGTLRTTRANAVHDIRAGRLLSGGGGDFEGGGRGGGASSL